MCPAAPAPVNQEVAIVDVFPVLSLFCRYVFHDCVGIRKALKAVSRVLDGRVGDDRRSFPRILSTAESLRRHCKLGGGSASISGTSVYRGSKRCVFITAVPIIKLFARGEGDSGGQRECVVYWYSIQ
jgi:hypothetical protein